MIMHIIPAITEESRLNLMLDRTSLSVIAEKRLDRDGFVKMLKRGNITKKSAIIEIK